MDSVTQVLLGATIAEAGFRRKLGGSAVAWGAFCGLAPDLDMITAAFGEWNELAHHRGVSHSLLALTAAAPLLGALAWRWPGKKQGSVVSWMHLTFWALITHPLLDACTAYGTQLLAPLSSERFAIDAIAIVDLVYTLPLLVAVVWARRGLDRTKSARFAAGALVFTTAYLGLGFVQSQRAIGWVEEDLAASAFSSVETRALPTLGNQLVRRVIARDGEGEYRATIVSLSAPRALTFFEVRDDDDPLIDIARRDPRIRLFQWFTMGFAPMALVHEDDGLIVRVSDLRYGSTLDPRRSMWGADARFDRDGHLLGVERWNTNRERDPRAELAALWAHIVGDDEALRALR